METEQQVGVALLRALADELEAGKLTPTGVWEALSTEPGFYAQAAAVCDRLAQAQLARYQKGRTHDLDRVMQLSSVARQLRFEARILVDEIADDLPL